MRKVKSISDLNNLALKSGSKISNKSGKVFNSSKKKVQMRPIPEPAPMPAPMPEPVPAPIKKEPMPLPAAPDLNSKAIMSLSESVSESSRANVMMLDELKSAIISAQTQALGPVLSWEFTHVRDDKGYLVKTIANATVVKPTLN
jgi:hypothetical protein